MLKSVLETCVPRESIIKGTFNPEIFTAALGPVVKYYQGEKTNIDAIYTDAKLFFTQGTYLTDGMKTTLRNVFVRLSGDNGAPSVQRLETAFGGGKTHTLIACTHIASKGKELAGILSDTFNSADVLPEPGSVKVVGIAGDELPVVKPIGNKLIPFTLWGEIAYQIGGTKLYSKVKNEAESYASPGTHFFDEIFNGRKVLVLIDEIAQYAARLEVAQPGRGMSSVSAFLFAFCNYAQAHSNISVVITLASTVNAFSEATDELKRSLQDISDGTITDAMAEDIVTKSTKELMDVSVRTSLSVTPVQSNEISNVLAKRLFESIDMVSAKTVVKEYSLMYKANPSAVPAEASRSSYEARMLQTYPFHPSLIDFLNGKLAQVPNFQGTRGVLRTLALVVRCIWAEQSKVPMIHVSDIDMRNVAICDEILSKTGKIPLRLVLNTDVGSVGSTQLADGVSISQGLDKDNPHPDGIPMYEKSWKVVFLNSLVGELQDKFFGVTEQEGVLQAATPILEMEQVRMALEAIGDNAFYLRYDNGRYYAHLDPTINSILSRIRQSVSQKDVDKRIESVTRKLIKENNNFKVYVDVKYPQDIPDEQNKIEVGVISPSVKKINVEEFFIYKGDNRPRIQQNIVVLLLPKTAVVEGSSDSIPLFQEDLSTDRLKQRLNLLARQVIANDILRGNPSAYGVTTAQIDNNPQFVENARKQALSLEEAVTELYKVLCYPDGTGYPCKLLRSAAGESGATILSEIQTVLEANGELIRVPNTGSFSQSLLKDLAKLYFFSNGITKNVKEIEQNFYNVRRWPIVLDRDTLRQVIYNGLSKNIWVAFRMSDDPTDAMPMEVYWAEKEIPLGVDIFNGNYSLISYEGAKSRDWLGTVRPVVANGRIKEVIKKLLRANGALKVRDIDTAVQDELGDVPVDIVHENICDMVRNEGYALYYGDVHQKERPDELILALQVCSLTTLDDDLVMISKAEMSVRGWFGVNDPGGNTYSGIIVNNAELVFDLLGRLGSMYNRGKAKSTISNLDIAELKLANGGKIRFAMDDVTPNDVKNLDELFADIVNCSTLDDDTEGSITIDNPVDGCALADELRGAIK